MNTQDENYFMRLTAVTDELLKSLNKFNGTVQEGFDRRLDQGLPTDEEFEDAGQLDHLTQARIVALLQTRSDINDVLEANFREGWNNLYEVVS